MDAHGQAQVAEVRPITIAVVALGGEGGGVLADWIVDLAQHGGYLAQATSVPGVAQRTGATVYYVELFPKAQADGREPVLALMPVPGDVDVVLASELMEAARAVERGFVTPERTLLIASTHRVFAMTEKIALADGREDAAALLAACRDAARELVSFDMAGLADATGSVLSAVLFGALAGSGALPFARTAFEAAIRRGQVGVNSSLAAFAAGFEAAHSGEAAAPAAASLEGGARDASRAVRDLLDAAARDFSGEARAVVMTAIPRLDDYQDTSYARHFLARLARFQDIDRQYGDGSGALLAETARQLALGMSYEDTIRVADLKIRSSRFARVREEAQIKDGQILQIAEFFHPRTQEIADTLPAASCSFTRWRSSSPCAAAPCASPANKPGWRIGSTWWRRPRARIIRSPCRSRACAAWSKAMARPMNAGRPSSASSWSWSRVCSGAAIPEQRSKA
jgi:indolepyruvate ferredoxin oxidoreductase beta subunit